MSQLRKTIKKPKLLRSNPFRFYAIRNQGFNPLSLLIDDEDLFVNHNRRFRVENNSNVEDDSNFSQYVKFRLWLARQLALKRFDETWGNYPQVSFVNSKIVLENDIYAYILKQK